MRIGLMGANCQDRIEKHYALLCPVSQATMGWCIYIQIVFKLFKYIF